MITFQDIQFLDGSRKDLKIKNKQQKIIPAEHLLALPAVIDPHVHFRTPGMEYKEDWHTGSAAAIRGGCSTVFDMPNTIPPTITQNLLTAKKKLIDRQLAESQRNLRYHLFFGADKRQLDQIPLVKNDIIGIKVFMGCSTGNLVIDDDISLEKVFSLAAELNLIVAVHAEDEHLIRKRKEQIKEKKLPYHFHSRLRDEEVAMLAVKKAIHFCRLYKTKLYILHVSTQDEINLISAAKQEGLPVFAETTPHHLFFNDSAYHLLQGKAVVNPPLRKASHQAALFAAIKEGVIDTIGSDHAPHTLEEKMQPYGECPSGMPGIEFMLPLLLNACHEKKLNLTEIESLTSKNANKIFNLTNYSDWVMVDLAKTQTVSSTVSRCAWTPYAGMALTGWPVYTVIGERVYVNF